jgi:hypothetical protein
VSYSFVQCLLQSCFRSELKEFWSVNELSYLFYPINIRAFCMAVSLCGSWVSLSPGKYTFFWSTGIHCFSVAHHQSGVGNLRVSDFFQFVGCRLHLKRHISRKDWVFLLLLCGCGGKRKEDKSVLVHVHFALKVKM